MHVSPVDTSSSRARLVTIAYLLRFPSIFIHVYATKHVLDPDPIAIDVPNIRGVCLEWLESFSFLNARLSITSRSPKSDNQCVLSTRNGEAKHESNCQK